MADGPKMFSKPAALAKKVPKWAYYVSGGILIAGGVMYFRNRQAVTDPSGDLAGDEGAVGYTDPTTVTPGLIVPPVIGGEAVPAEINTDIPTGTMSVFSDLFSTFGGILQDQSDLIGILAQSGKSSDSNGAGGPAAPAGSPGGVVTKTPAKPKPNPLAKLDAGYHGGATVNLGPNARRTFTGAIGWIRIGDGGKGADHWIDVHVRYCNKLERWRVYPNRKGSPWNKTWQGSRPEICK